MATELEHAYKQIDYLAQTLEITVKQKDEIKAVALAMREWIDAVPKDTVLPAMPGFDRDWANSVLED